MKKMPIEIEHYRLLQGHEVVAEVSGPRDQAVAEIMHYAMQYGPDGWPL